MEKNKYSGTGILYDDNAKIIYEGEWKLGNPNGMGIKYEKDNAIIYDGEWKNGNLNGKGKTIYDMCNIRYDGNWENGKAHGLGILYSEDKRIIYEGEWKHGRPNGVGTCYYEDGITKMFQGEFKNGRFSGQIFLEKLKEDNKEILYIISCKDIDVIQGSLVGKGTIYEYGNKDLKKSNIEIFNNKIMKNTTFFGEKINIDIKLPFININNIEVGQGIQKGLDMYNKKKSFLDLNEFDIFK